MSYIDSSVMQPDDNLRPVLYMRISKAKPVRGISSPIALETSPIGVCSHVTIPNSFFVLQASCSFAYIILFNTRPLSPSLASNFFCRTNPTTCCSTSSRCRAHPCSDDTESRVTESAFSQLRVKKIVGNNFLTNSPITFKGMSMHNGQFLDPYKQVLPCDVSGRSPKNRCTRTTWASPLLITRPAAHAHASRDFFCTIGTARSWLAFNMMPLPEK